MTDDSPREVDVDDVTDISELKDHYRELKAQNQHLKGLIADDRQKLQVIEFKHRESVDQIAILRTQKESMEKQLKDRLFEDGDRDSIDEVIDDISSASQEDEENIPPKRTRKQEIARLKEEIEDLQAALAEERMLGMQLDFSNRQSSQRADTLQYQLAEEKLKNMHLQSSHQQLQLGDSNSSGFVHLRDSNDNGKDVIDNKLIDDDINQNNRKKTRKSKRNRKKRSNNDDDDASSTSDLSREFDLKIEEDPRLDDGNVDPETEAKDLRHKLLDEQLKTEELKHRHRKSELQLMQYKEALDEMRAKHESGVSGVHLDPESAAQMETPRGGSGGLSQEEKLRYEAEIAQLREQLEISKKKTMSLDKQRRDSLNIMSKNFFAKQLKAARDTHSLEEQLQSEIDDLKGQIYDVTKSKILLLQSTHDTIDQLREHIVELSNRLRKYENWDSNSNGNDTANGYDVTDL